jgi:hypothetical protein
MWYNRIVMDENNNEILREKCFVSEVYELYNGLGMDVCGNYIIEFWSEE